jgi:hypothetical protein
MKVYVYYKLYCCYWLQQKQNQITEDVSCWHFLEFLKLETNIVNHKCYNKTSYTMCSVLHSNLMDLKKIILVIWTEPNGLGDGPKVRNFPVDWLNYWLPE